LPLLFRFAEKKLLTIAFFASFPLSALLSAAFSLSFPAALYPLYSSAFQRGGEGKKPPEKSPKNKPKTKTPKNRPKSPQNNKNRQKNNKKQQPPPPDERPHRKNPEKSIQNPAKAGTGRKKSAAGGQERINR